MVFDGVLGLEHGVGDESVGVFVGEPVEHAGTVPASGEDSGHAELGQMLRHRGGGLPTRSARVLTDSSPPASARTILTRVASASIENTSTATSTRSSPAQAAMPNTPLVRVSARIRKIIVGEGDRSNSSLRGPLSWVVSAVGEEGWCWVRTWARGRRAVSLAWWPAH